MTRSFETKELIKRMVEIAWENNNPFLPSALSALPIIQEVYSNFDPKNDVFILSKGHAVLALYAILEQYGFKPNIKPTQCTRDIKNGIYCSTGSLGHGLPIAFGIAFAKKLKQESGIVYCLMGDGEMLEGTFWETINLIAEFDIENIKILVDYNDCQGCKKVPDVLLKHVAFFKKITWYSTIKGQGLKYLEGKNLHTFRMTEKDYKAIQAELA